MTTGGNNKTRRGVRPSTVFWGLFWITIVVLAAIYVHAQLSMRKLVLDADGEVVISEQFVEEWNELLPEILGKMAVEFDQAGGRIEVLIQKKVDEAFAPVYGQIPKFSDFHYSVEGEYTELAAALAGEAGGHAQRMLFQEVEFSERLEQNIEVIYDQSQPILTEAFERVDDDLRGSLDLSPSEMYALRSVMTLSIEDVKARFGELELALRSAGAAVGAGVAGTLMAKVVGKKVSAKVLAKVSAKGIAKAAGIGGGITGGAAAGSWLGPWGAAAGGVMGAIAAWLATDKLIIEIDEHLNEDEFVGAITQIIDQEKERITHELTSRYQAYVKRLFDANETKLKGLRTKDLIQR